MSNDIVITWSSDQKQLIQDYQARALLQDKEIARLKVLAVGGKAAGGAIGTSYRDATKEIERLGKAAQAAFQKPDGGMAKHLAQLKELRVMYRMGKIDAEQFAKAEAASSSGMLRQRYDESGATQRLRDKNRARAEEKKLLEQQAAEERSAAARSLMDQKKAAESLRLQKLTAIHQEQQDQKAAKDSLRLQKLTAIAENKQDEKKAADSLRLQKLTALQQNAEDQKKAVDSLKLQKLTAIHEQEQAEKASAANLLQEQKAAVLSLDLQKRTAIEQQMQANKNAADQVRKGLISESQQARMNFRERMRHIHDLRSAGALSQKEYEAAAKQAHDAWVKTSKIDIGAAWRSLPPMITSAVTLAGVLMATVTATRAVIQDTIERQENAKNANMTYAEARKDPVANLGKDMTGEEFDKWIVGASERTGQTPVFLARAAAGVLGGKGSRTVQDALAAMEATVPLERFNPSELTSVTRAVLQQQTVDKKFSFKEVLGQQIAARQASAVDTPDSFAQHVAYGSVGASSYGDSSQQYYTMAAYLANMGGDPSGQTSGTGVVNLEKQLMELHRGMQLGGDAEGLGKNTMERLKNVARNPKFAGLRDQLLGGNKSELAKELGMPGGATTARARNYGAIIKLLDNDATAWTELENTGKLIPELGKDSAGFVDKNLIDIDSHANQVALGDQGNKASEQRAQLGDTIGARRASAREGLSKNLAAAGQEYFYRKAVDAYAYVGTNMTESPERVQAYFQEQTANELRGNQRNVPRGGVEYNRLADAVKALESSSADLRRLADAYEKQGPPQVNVNVNVGGQEKPAPPRAIDLGKGFGVVEFRGGF
jgi:hypothetical protein